LNQIVPNGIRTSGEEEVDVDSLFWIDPAIEIVQQVFEDDAEMMNRQNCCKDIRNDRSDDDEV
jgi:hypothetical protein